MKHQLAVAACIILLAIASFTACKKDTSVTTYDCNGVTPTYTKDIKTIMDTYCATSGCHDAKTSKAGTDLSNYNSTKNAADKGSFLGSIEHKSGYRAMPQGGNQLSTTQRQLIYCWIQNGKLQ